MDVAAWLQGLGLERYRQAFLDHEVDALSLPHLTADDLKEIGVTAIGHRRRLLQAIAALSNDPGSSTPSTTTPTTARHAEAERRQLTVMFCDLVGSTALSTQLDPEDMREVIRGYQDACAGVITRFEGFVAKYMGDGVLTYFGYPRAHEDDAERAVRASLALVEAVAKLPVASGDSLAARIGIATGLVVVGDLVGEGAAQEQAVVGDTPNLAARLQEVATPGQVVIAGATRRLLGERFELADLGPQTLKGLAEAEAFAVVGERALESRFEAHSGQVLPMVGRDQELALLLERWAQAKAGEGQGMLLVGEAGIGKSRITRALLDAVTEEPYIRIRYQCSPYHSDSALWPVIQQLTYAAGIGAADPAVVALDKLEALLDRAGGREAAPLIADLIGIDGSDRYDPLDLSPQAQRVRTLDALVNQLIGLAAKEPVLMMLEDAHWIDPTTLELMEQCLDRIAAARALIVLTSRPDQQPELAGHPHVTRLTLNRLGRTGVEAIVARLGGEHLLGETIGAIIARTDGVPLFVEELTKAVLETGGASIPASLHDSLMARLDRIPEVKQVAQIAACIGREVDFTLLAAVADRPEPELLAALDQLAAAELIFRRATSPAVYSFKHALVQEAAYQSLLKTRRRELHARVVEALETPSARAAPAEPELLAYHCARAGLAEKAVDYRYQAGRLAAGRAAMAEAAEQLSLGIELLDSMPDGPERRRRELDLQTALGAALIAAKGYAADETGRAFTRARVLCAQAEDVYRLMPVLNGQMLFLNQRGERQATYEIAGEMLAVAEKWGDSSLLIPAHRVMSLTSLHLGRFMAAREHAEQVLALYEPLEHRNLASVYAFDQRTVAQTYLASALFALGYPDQARRRSAAAVEEARALAHPASLVQALQFMSIMQCMMRDIAGLRDTAEMMIAVAVERGLPHFVGPGKFFRGVTWLALGQEEDGLQEMREGWVELAARDKTLGELLLAEICVAPARRRSISELVMALTSEGRRVSLWVEAEWCRMAGERLLSSAEPDQKEAEAHFRRALEVAREQEAKSWELRAATSLARLWAEQGKRADTHDLLAPIYGWFTEGFEHQDLKDAKALLDELA